VGVGIVAPVARAPAGTSQRSFRQRMAENWEINFWITCWQTLLLDLMWAGRMRKDGTYGLTNDVNTSKISGFLLFYMVYIYV